MVNAFANLGLYFVQGYLEIPDYVLYTSSFDIHKFPKYRSVIILKDVEHAAAQTSCNRL